MEKTTEEREREYMKKLEEKFRMEIKRTNKRVGLSGGTKKEVPLEVEP